MSSYELAQLNLAIMKKPLEASGMADFVANLDRINTMADASPGFAGRLQTEAGLGGIMPSSVHGSMLNLCKLSHGRQANTKTEAM